MLFNIESIHTSSKLYTQCFPTSTFNTKLLTRIVHLPSLIMQRYTQSKIFKIKEKKIIAENSKLTSKDIL